MRKNNKKGFTLVELLVVIAILAILASVAVVGQYDLYKYQDAWSDLTITPTTIKRIIIPENTKFKLNTSDP